MQRIHTDGREVADMPLLQLPQWPRFHTVEYDVTSHPIFGAEEERMRENESPTTISTFAAVLRETLRDYDVDVDRLFREAGISQQSLEDPLRRIPVSSMTRLWNGAVHETGDDSFGLQVARRLSPSSFFALGISALSSQNAFEALKVVLNSFSLVSTGARIRLGFDGGMVFLELSHKPGCPEHAPPAVDAALGGCLHLARHHVGLDIGFEKVSFRHAAPADPQVFERWFDCPVAFNAERNAFYLSRVQDLFLPFPTANAALLSSNIKAVTDYLARLSDGSVGNRVRSEVARRLEDGKDVSQKTVSRSLGMSERKLQNILKEEGTSFKTILDWVRERKAIHLLTVDGWAISEVALELGFKEISSFTRAFKRWTGRVPSKYLSRAAANAKTTAAAGAFSARSR